MGKEIQHPFEQVTQKQKAELMARKTAKDYRKEYNELTKQQNALEVRIRKRLETLCNQHPDVKTGSITTAKDLIEYNNHVQRFDVEAVINYIEKIETELAKKQVYKQTTIEGF